MYDNDVWVRQNLCLMSRTYAVLRNKAQKLLLVFRKRTVLLWKKKDCFTKRPRHVFAENVTPCHASLLSLKVIMIKWAAFKIWNGGWTFLLIEGLFDSIQDKNTHIGVKTCQMKTIGCKLYIFDAPTFWLNHYVAVRNRSHCSAV